MIRLGLSNKKKLPCLKTDENFIYPIWKYFFLREVENTKLKLDNEAYSFLLEYKNFFYKEHIPSFDLRNKIILDVGAGCGESAYLYLEKLKAKKVICIENNERRLSYLNYNYANNQNVEILPISWKNEILDIYDYDFIKMNIEGYELELLNYDLSRLKPSNIQVHAQYIMDKFLEKGFTILTNKNGFGWVKNW